MKPVHTARSNFTYVGPTPQIGDLHCHVPHPAERTPNGPVESVWWFTPEERMAIARGANIRLAIMQEPMPPVHLSVTDEQGDGEDAPDVLERLWAFGDAKREAT